VSIADVLGDAVLTRSELWGGSRRVVDFTEGHMEGMEEEEPTEEISFSFSALCSSRYTGGFASRNSIQTTLGLLDSNFFFALRPSRALSYHPMQPVRPRMSPTCANPVIIRALVLQSKGEGGRGGGTGHHNMMVFLAEAYGQNKEYIIHTVTRLNVVCLTIYVKVPAYDKR